jgi:hypothetical protein
MLHEYIKRTVEFFGHKYSPPKECKCKDMKIVTRESKNHAPPLIWKYYKCNSCDRMVLIDVTPA